MRDQSWIYDGIGSAVVLVSYASSGHKPTDWYRRISCFVRFIRRTAADLVEILAGDDWNVTLEPGYGSFLDSTARAVASAGSEEEAELVMSAVGNPPDFLFRYGDLEPSVYDSDLLEVVDAKTRKTLWKRP